MDFDLRDCWPSPSPDGYELQDRYLNPQRPGCCTRSASTRSTSGRGRLPLRRGRQRAMPTSWPASASSASAATIPWSARPCTTCSTPSWPTWSQFDCALLPGLLAERLLAKAPGLDRVYFCNSGTEAVEAALKFARYATGRGPHPVLRPRLPRPDRRLAVGQRRGRVPRRLRPAAARQPHPARRPRRARARAAPRRRGRADRRADPGQGRARPAARASWPPPRSCCTSTARCSSATRCRPASAGPGGSSPTSTRTSSRTS